MGADVLGESPRARRSLLLVVALAAAIFRLLYLAEIHDHPYWRTPLVDAADYHARAQQVMRGESNEPAGDPNQQQHGRECTQRGRITTRVNCGCRHFYRRHVTDQPYLGRVDLADVLTQMCWRNLDAAFTFHPQSFSEYRSAPVRRMVFPRHVIHNQIRRADPLPTEVFAIQPVAVCISPEIRGELVSQRSF